MQHVDRVGDPGLGTLHLSRAGLGSTSFSEGLEMMA
jgi:hypothetical protein